MILRASANPTLFSSGVRAFQFHISGMGISETKMVRVTSTDGGRHRIKHEIPDLEPGTYYADVWVYYGAGRKSSSLRVLATVPDQTPPIFVGGKKAVRHLSKLSRKGTAVGEPVLAQEDVNDEVKYELVWRDGAPFAVDADTGQIRTLIPAKNWRDGFTD